MNTNDKIFELIRDTKVIESETDFSNSVIERFNREKQTRIRARQRNSAYLSSAASVILILVLSYSIPQFAPKGNSLNLYSQNYTLQAPGLTAAAPEMRLEPVDEAIVSEALETEVANSVIADADISGIIRDYNIDEKELLAMMDASEEESLLNY